MGIAPTITDLAPFRHPDLRYTVSGRHIDGQTSVSAYLKTFFPYIDPTQIESVFAFVEQHAPLYGGRVHQPERAFNPSHLDELYRLGVNLSIPFTNHFFDRDAYTKSLPVLDANHRAGNSVILMDDEFARQVRQDFPLYRRKGSVIKKLLSPTALAKALDLYDTVVLPMERNDDFSLLQTLEPKESIQIFANASCAYTCPAKICYPSVSRINRGEAPADAFACSQPKIARDMLGTIFFDIDQYRELGFTNFKLVPVQNARKSARALAQRLTKLEQPR